MVSRRRLLGAIAAAPFALATTAMPRGAHAQPSAEVGDNRVYLPLVARAEPPERLGYGVNVANLGHLEPVVTMGFRYVKAYLSWASAEPSKGVFTWQQSPTANDVDNIANAVAQRGLKLVLRVDTPPAWAAPGEGNRPPSNPADFGDFMGALAQHLRGRVAAYEIWNEPNLSYEWGNHPPNPEEYGRLLQAVYPRIKAADPSVVVITAGLASTGGDGGSTSLNDVEFLHRMYRAGAKGNFDAIGSHPYGFSTPPETRNANNVTDFQRAADQRQVMVEHGDADKTVWATEFGWLIDPTYYGHPDYLNDPLWNGRQWQRVSPEQQAEYLVRAYQFAYNNWPWMRCMLLFNLDFSTVSWYPPAEPMRFYSILDENANPRPAFNALRAMAKPTN